MTDTFDNIFKDRSKLLILSKTSTDAKNAYFEDSKHSDLTHMVEKVSDLQIITVPSWFSQFRLTAAVLRWVWLPEVLLIRPQLL